MNCFFFSSRRRHTRFKCDWSSDVCSSDLAADDLAYKKGQAVLGMFEQWLGPETFRAGVIAYLKEHEWGNAVGSDLWDALSKASGKDASAAMSTFLDQEGVPLVTASVLPDGRVKLSQKRFLGDGITPPPEKLWR